MKIMEIKTRIEAAVLKTAVCVLLIAAGSACYAADAQVHRFQKELSDACAYTVSINYGYYDTYNCLANKAADPYIWRAGWNRPVKADVLSILADNYDPVTAELCDAGAQAAADDGIKRKYAASFEKLAQTLKSQGVQNRKYKLRDLSTVINGRACGC